MFSMITLMIGQYCHSHPWVSLYNVCATGLLTGNPVICKSVKSIHFNNGSRS